MDLLAATARSRELLVMVIFMLSSSTASHFFELKAHVGDRFFIPCFNTPDQQIYFWKIQDKLYPAFEILVSELNLRGVSNGLIVHGTLPHAGGNYSCLTYGSRNSLKKISTAYLDVQIGQNSSKDEQSYLDNDDSTHSNHHIKSELHLRVTLTDIIYIPCLPALGTSNVTIWEINGLLYPTFQLPPRHSSQFGGIFVRNITRHSENLIGRVYRCFCTQEKDNALQLVYTVNVSLSGTQPSLSSFKQSFNHNNNMPHELKIVSRGVYFGLADITLKFLIANVTEATDCIPGQVTFSMAIEDVSGELWNESTTNYKPSFTTPNDVFSHINAYGGVHTINGSNLECARLNYKFKPQGNEISLNQCVPEYGDGCVGLPENQVGLVVIWPINPLSDEDCACGVFNESLSPVKFSDCYCLALNRSTYDVELVENHLCWKNLSKSTNDTKILLVRDLDQAPNLDSNVRLFLDQFLLTVEDPDLNPPSITNTSKPSSVCIRAKSTEWSTVHSINVMIYDATNDSIQNKKFLTSYEVCEDFVDFPQVCAPFTVKAIASTLCTDSLPVECKIPGSDPNPNYCGCVKDKVSLKKLDMTTNSTSISVHFHATCLNLTKYDIDSVSNLHLQATNLDCGNCPVVQATFNISCFQKPVITVSGLNGSTSYNLYVAWDIPTENMPMCYLWRSNEPITTKWSLRKLITVLTSTIIPGSVVVVVIILLVLIFAKVHSGDRCNRQGTQQPLLNTVTGTYTKNT